MFIPSRKNLILTAAIALSCQASGVSGGAPAPVSNTTANASARRDGWFSNERTLNPANVGGGSFGKLYSWTLLDAGRIYAQPLIAKGVTVAGSQVDLLIAVSLGGHIYAYDVNNKSQNPLWQLTTVSGFPAGNDSLFQEQIACLATPALDLAAGVMYETCADSGQNWTLYKITLATGAVAQSVVISGSVAGTGDPGGGDTIVSGRLQFTGKKHISRAGLMLANGNVYIPFAANGDFRPWHGWIFAYRTSDLTQVATFCASPSGYGGGFWGSGLSSDASGNLYAFSGNGTWDGVTAFGESILKFSPALAVLDWFTPANHSTLESVDADLSSGQAILMSSSNGSPFLVGGAKDFRVYRMDTGCLGHLEGGGGGCSQQIWSFDNQTIGDHGGVYGGIFANNTAFMPEVAGPVRAFAYSPGTAQFNQTPYASTATTHAFPGAAQMSYSSNGTASGVLWLVSNAVDSGSSPQIGIFRAVNPATMVEIYNSNQFNGDEIGQMNKFNLPVVVDGKVYVTSSNVVNQYGLGAR